MRVREPVARPLDVVGIELLLTASQAFLVGVLMYLAIGIWDDRGVGLGPVAMILALLGSAVGAAWLYWLFGGVGWPMAAANTPVAMFLGFALVLDLAGDLVVRVEGVPLLLAALAATYGVIGGVFIDSPRRWRWDQRQKPRDGAKVPLVTETTQAVIAAVPRSLPRRASAEPEPPSELAARIEASTPGPTTASPGQTTASTARTTASRARTTASTARTTPPGDERAPRPTGISTVAKKPDDSKDVSAPATDPTEPGEPAVDDESKTVPAQATSGLTMPTDRLAGTEVREEPVDDEDHGIELPTAVEPRAQRSPWAWAAPPEWSRDEDDATITSSASKRS